MKTQNIRLSGSVTCAIQSVEAAIAHIMKGDVVLTRIHIQTRPIRSPEGIETEELEENEKFAYRWVKVDCQFIVDYGEGSLDDFSAHHSIAWVYLWKMGSSWENSPWVPSGGVYIKIDDKEPAHVKFSWLASNPPFRTWGSIHLLNENEEGSPKTSELDYTPLIGQNRLCVEI